MTDDRWLVMSGDTVINVAVWSGDAWMLPDGQTRMQAPDGVGIGWRLIDGVWTPPPEEP